MTIITNILTIILIIIKSIINGISIIIRIIILLLFKDKNLHENRIKFININYLHSYFIEINFLFKI